VKKEIESNFCLHSNHNTVDLYLRCDWAVYMNLPIIEGPNGTSQNQTKYMDVSEGTILIEPRHVGKMMDQVNLTLPILTNEKISR